MALAALAIPILFAWVIVSYVNTSQPNKLKRKLKK